MQTVLIYEYSPSGAIQLVDRFGGESRKKKKRGIIIRLGPDLSIMYVGKVGLTIKRIMGIYGL